MGWLLAQIVSVVYTALTVLNPNSTAPPDVPPVATALIGAIVERAHNRFVRPDEISSSSDKYPLWEESMSNLTETLLLTTEGENKEVLEKIAAFRQSTDPTVIKDFQTELAQMIHENHEVTMDQITLPELKASASAMRKLADALQSILEEPVEGDSDVVNTLLGTFRHYSKKTPPAEVLQKLFSSLSSANPIYPEMKRNVLQSRTLRESYLNFLTNALVKALVVDAFYQAATGKDITSAYEQSVKNAGDLMKKARELVAQCPHVPKADYWPSGVGDLMRAATAGGHSTAQVADSLKEGLDRIFTGDVFSIFTYMCTAEQEPRPVNVTGRTSDDYTLTHVEPNWTKGRLCLVTLRSERFHEMHATKKAIVRASYIGYVQVIAGKELSHRRYHKELHQYPFAEAMNKLQPGVVVGFFIYPRVAAHDICVRFTRGGESILTDEEMQISETHYNGITWS